MVASLAQIEQDLAAINQSVVQLSEDLQAAYSDYLSVLGAAVHQQLIMACYSVCTEGYPERFLALSFGQRQELQRILRQIANQTREELLAQLYPPTAEVEPDVDPLFAELAMEGAEGRADTPIAPPDQAHDKKQTRLDPPRLAHWQQSLEQAIATELQTVSYAVNRTLQQAGVLPGNLPEPLLEAATKAESSEVGAGKPNLLNLLVETRKGSEGEGGESENSKPHTLLHIIAVNLRLAEIEFADVAVGTARNRIRQLSAQLRNIGRDYQKKQRERAIAEAQAAWRAGWYDE